MLKFAHGRNHEWEHAADERDNPLWKKHLEPWLRQLASLQNVPANYLLPVEKLLPRESIRFFYVDQNWLVAALRGAFSVGGGATSDAKSTGEPFQQFLKLADSYRMGFVLRSDVVNGWPGLIIDDGTKNQPLRRLLSRDTLLGLFQTEVKQVDFHQKPEVMHFGLLQEGNTFKKAPRDKDGNESTTENKWVTVQLRNNDNTNRVIEIKRLASDLNLGAEPAKFAMAMIEGSPRVRFEME